MSQPVHLTSSKVLGHGLSYSATFPRLRVYEKTLGILYCHSDDGKPFLHQAGLFLRCSSRRITLTCKASSSNQRRNPDFSRRKRQGFYRNRNRPQTEETDGSENLQEPDLLSSKNGPLLAFSNSTPRQATASPGPRELEILQLFRKVQAKLRDRASSKEEKRVEVSRGRGQSEENETVDSLLELLRKHSVDKGNMKVNGRSESGIEFDLNPPGQKQIHDEGRNNNSYNSNSNIRDVSRNIDRPSQARPASNFRRRSPVPQVRYEPIISPKEAAASAPSPNLDRKNGNSSASSYSSVLSDPDLEYDQELEIQPEVEIDQEIKDEPQLDSSYMGEEMRSELIKINGSAEVAEANHDNAMEDEEEPETSQGDLSSMKVQELKAMAKARGMKGFSKLKKSELIGLLSEDLL